MSLRILFGTDTILLARNLARNLAGQQADTWQKTDARDPLEPATILVPNRNVEKWLRFVIARENGVAANIAFPYLEHGLWDAVREIGGIAPGDAGFRRMPFESAAVRIAACLIRDCRVDAGRQLDADKSDRPRSPLVDYCLADRPFDDAGFGKRLWQLAEKLARLFTEYEYSRTDMVMRWKTASAADIESLNSSDPLEASQARIYREVFVEGGKTGGPEAADERTLFQIASEVFDGENSGCRSDLQPLYVFGMSSLSRYHCGLLWKIGRFRDVVVYHFNGCREFWEDATTPREDRWAAVRRAGTADDSGDIDLPGLDDNDLLKAWGKAGRETVKLLADLEDDTVNVSVEWIDDETGQRQPQSVLATVRHGIRHRTADFVRVPADRSVRVLSCPGPQREVEAVADDIVARMNADPTVRLDEIAVLVTDMERYKSLICQVFDGRSDPIPFNLADSCASSDSVFGHGVKSLLGLASGDFSRRAVFELFYNPCFQAAVGTGPGDLDRWLEWVSRLGVYHDYECGGSVGTAFTWSQALKRIRFGRIMTVRGHESPDGTGPFAGIWPYRDSESDTDTSDRFCESVERLFAGISGISATQGGGRGCARDPAEWAKSLKKLVDGMLGVPEDRTEEDAVRRALSDGLERLFGSESGLGRAMCRVGGDSAVPVSVLSEIVESLISGIPTGRGAYLSDGVTVASLKPMRPIPFRHVYVLGMQEGAFPGNAAESSVDLRVRCRRIGDVSTPDAGRYMFMETLLCAGESLCLTYDGWDTQKDERREPCSVVRQLMNHVSRNVISSESDTAKNEFSFESVPLSPFSPAYMGDSPIVEPVARGWMERCTAALLSIPAGCSPDDVVRAAEQAIRQVPGSEILNEIFGRTSSRGSDNGEIDADGAAENVRVTVRELALFLENPMKARLRRHFGVYDDFSDPGAAFVEDEPFNVDRALAARLNADWIRDFLESGDVVVADGLFRKQASRLHGMSLAPAPAFLMPAVSSMLTKLSEVAESKAKTESLAGRRLVRDAVIGAGSVENRPAGIRYPAVVVDLGGGRTAEISGALDFVSESDEGRPPVYVSVRDAGGSPTRFPKGLFVPAVFAAAVRAAGLSGHLPFDVVEASRSGFHVVSVDVSAARAALWLADLISDYLDRSKVYENLPYLAVADVFKETGTGGLQSNEELNAALIEAIDDKASDSFGGYYPSEAERLLADMAFVPDDPVAVVERRYGLLWRSAGVQSESVARERGRK